MPLIYANIKSEHFKCYQDDSTTWKQFLEQHAGKEERDLHLRRVGSISFESSSCILLSSNHFALLHTEGKANRRINLNQFVHGYRYRDKCFDKNPKRKKLFCINIVLSWDMLFGNVNIDKIGDKDYTMWYWLLLYWIINFFLLIIFLSSVSRHF